MLCWPAFGEHEAHIRNMKRARILILAQGIFPADSRATALRRRPMGGSNALLASIWNTFREEIECLKYLVCELSNV